MNNGHKKITFRVSYSLNKKHYSSAATAQVMVMVVIYNNDIDHCRHKHLAVRDEYNLYDVHQTQSL
jgi:hypothetical protein